MLPNVVVGGGIVGLAVAKALQELDPGRDTESTGRVDYRKVVTALADEVEARGGP